MKIINPIFVSMALVVATLFFCGKKMNFILYTLLGRIIMVLFIIGLTIVNKYAGIIATLTISALYYHTDYKEGFVEANEHDGANDDDDDDDDDVPETPQEASAPAPTPSGGDMSSSSANFSSEANSQEEPSEPIEPPSTTPVEPSSGTPVESSSS